MKALIVIPTYNEKDNITPIVQAVLQANPQVNILIVDDNPAICQALALMLELNGYEPLFCHSAEEALFFVRQRDIA